MEQAKLKVLGMSCGHCKNAIEKAVGALEGVRSVTVNLGEKEVEVEFDSGVVGIDAIKDVIDDAGYEVL
jgi:copper chaperone